MIKKVKFYIDQYFTGKKMEKESVNSSQVLVQPPKWSDLPKVAVTGFENLMQKLPPCSCGKEDGFGNIIRAKFYCDKDCNG